MPLTMSHFQDLPGSSSRIKQKLVIVVDMMDIFFHGFAFHARKSYLNCSLFSHITPISSPNNRLISAGGWHSVKRKVQCGLWLILCLLCVLRNCNPVSSPSQICPWKSWLRVDAFPGLWKNVVLAQDTLCCLCGIYISSWENNSY